jgi:hypothetical protein
MVGSGRGGLQLESYGRGGSEFAVHRRPRVTAELERVTYEWGQGLREWWVNDRRGLEHGFTVGERPSGEGEGLVLRLTVRGGLQPRVQEGGRGVSFVDGSGRAVVNYAGLKVWDADGQVLTARMEAVGAEVRLEVEEGSARFPLK